MSKMSKMFYSDERKMKKRTSAVFKSFMNLTTKPVVLALVCLSFDLLDFFHVCLFGSLSI